MPGNLGGNKRRRSADQIVWFQARSAQLSWVVQRGRMIRRTAAKKRVVSGDDRSGAPAVSPNGSEARLVGLCPRLALRGYLARKLACVQVVA